MLATIAASWIALLSMQPSQPAHGIGIASIPVTKPGIHLPQKPAARRGRESRDQAKANG
jgi:hypothetical protein